MTVMTLDTTDVTALLDLDFETTMTSALTQDQAGYRADDRTAGTFCCTADLCCISARSHTGC